MVRPVRQTHTHTHAEKSMDMEADDEERVPVRLERTHGGVCQKTCIMVMETYNETETSCLELHCAVQLLHQVVLLLHHLQSCMHGLPLSILTHSLVSVDVRCGICSIEEDRRMGAWPPIRDPHPYLMGAKCGIYGSADR